MNPRDTSLWRTGLAKVTTGQRTAVTAAEREVLVHFGGTAMQRRLEGRAMPTRKAQTTLRHVELPVRWAR